MSLPADLIYSASQLWFAREEGDANQWLFYLEELSSSRQSGSTKLSKSFTIWEEFLLTYYPKILEKKTKKKIRKHIKERRVHKRVDAKYRNELAKSNWFKRKMLHWRMRREINHKLQKISKKKTKEKRT